MSAQPLLKMTRFDLERLERVLERADATANVELLRAELERAMVVEPRDLPAGVVTMNSLVRFSDEKTGEESEVRLVFPGQTDPDHRCISILAPVGSALIGLSCGDRIEWPVPGGHVRQLRVVAVVYQPEAAGDLHL